ncbi:hypothetical protein T484DRAFT_1793016 [Baffinella frigidus]|nr:hypothetical protein T484DRAFT_1793016 [Cryptophyta sp. CCMP2293]
MISRRSSSPRQTILTLDALGEMTILTLDELGEMVLESLKKMLKDRKDFVVSLFKAADTDMSGKVDFSEWQCLMYEMDPDCKTASTE